MIRLCVMTDVTAEDSGNYTCEVRGSKSAILASVTHFVFVRGTSHSRTPCLITLSTFINSSKQLDTSAGQQHVVRLS